MTRAIALATLAILALLQIFATTDVVAAQPKAQTTKPLPLAPCDPARDENCEPPPGAGERCGGVTGGPPPGTGRFSCQFTITNAYGTTRALPAPNAPVRVETRWCNNRGSTVLATAGGFTDATGSLKLFVSSRSPNVIECSLGPSAEPLFHGPKSAVRKSNTKLPTGTSVALTTQIQPAPDATDTLEGLEPGAGRMDLYQSGAYDKVLLIAEQFDQREHDALQNRDRRRFWKQLSPLLRSLFDRGWDVWLVQPHDTGESLHEQAAEFAQAIAVARAQFPFRPQCLSPNVAVLGFNTGGLVARIATARWEADPAWRAQLRLPDALPVHFVATFDAPHYGMHLNLDMQESLWKNKSGLEIHSETNLDSCAASQVLRGRYDPSIRLRRTNRDFLAFFVDGTETRFHSKIDGKDHVCAAGPAVATLNAARGVPGWPSTPIRVGFAQSQSDDRTKCFAPLGPEGNTNAAGQNLCKHLMELCVGTVCSPGIPCNCPEANKPFTPTVGQTWMRIAKTDPSLPDLCPDEKWNTEDRVEWSDIAPGSRSPLFLDGFIGAGSAGPIFCKATASERFPTTLVPFVSAAGTQGPGASSPYEPVRSPFTVNEFHASAFPHVADVIGSAEGGKLLERLNALAPGCTPPVVDPK
jgi:hypothetical protein